MIYFDQTASTKPLVEVLDLYNNLSLATYANPSAIHRLGFQAEQEIKRAKQELSTVLSSREDELVFTSGATEAINLAIKGYCLMHAKPGDEIITWNIEHKATLATCEYLASLGYVVHKLSTTPEFLPHLDELAKLLTHRTAMITLSMVNNEIGSMPDLEAIIDLRNRLAPKAVIHIDAVQAFTKFIFKPGKIGVDLASFSGHKIGAPKGIGLLYVRKNIRLQPQNSGGGHQDGRRSGTENPILYRCLSLAATLKTKTAGADLNKVSELYVYLESLLQKSGLEYKVNKPLRFSPYIFNVSFPGNNPETLVHALADKEIFVATHSACNSRDNRSYVLDALPIPGAYQTSALRISLAPEHEKKDIEILVSALVAVIKNLQNNSGKCFVKA